jgi:hypothetical protein
VARGAAEEQVDPAAVPVEAQGDAVDVRERRPHAETTGEPHHARVSTGPQCPAERTGRVVDPQRGGGAAAPRMQGAGVPQTGQPGEDLLGE